MALKPFTGALDEPGSAPAGLKPFDGALDEEKNAPGFVSTMKRTGGQMISGLGTTIEDVTGPNALTKGLTDTGRGIVERNPSAISGLSDVIDKPWETVKESVGQMAPQIGAGIIGRMAGGALGGAVAPIFVQEYGGIRDQQKEVGQEDKGRALAAATGATAIDFIGGPES